MADSRQPIDPAAPAVAAIVLAAGSSRRFGPNNKLLAAFRGQPLIRWAVTAFTESRADPVIVVTGPDRTEIETALAGLPVRTTHNPDHLEGMGGSIATGVAALPSGIDGVLVSPGDMPGITARLIDDLIKAFQREGGDRIIRPALSGGRPGHPVLWPARLLPRLGRISGAEGGKTLLSEVSSDIVHVPLNDEGAALDIDTVEELRRNAELLRDLHGR